MTERYYGSSRNGGYYEPQYEDGGGKKRKKRKKKKKTFGDIMSMLLMLIALCVFLFSGYTLFGFYKEYKKGSDEYENLADSYTSVDKETEDFDALEGAAENPGQSISGREVATIIENGQEVTVPVMKNPIDFDELSAVNEDIVGWLRIRALDISYPVVQGEDNDYYLHRTFEGVENFAGCIFLNSDNKPDLTDQNTIVYGHNMKDGSMFGKLKNFREPDTLKKSRYFWIFTPDIIYQYRIFSASVVSQVGLTYQTFFTDEEFDTFLNAAYQNNEIDAGSVDVTKEDRVVTLSTCTGDDATRFVVMGKLAQIYAAR